MRREGRTNRGGRLRANASRFASLGPVLGAIPRLEDLFAFALATAIAREALWLMPGSALPIALSAAAGLAAVAVVRKSAHERPSPPWLFWAVVALPVLVLWALRAPFPDIGYDTLNYDLHLRNRCGLADATRLYRRRYAREFGRGVYRPFRGR